MFNHRIKIHLSNCSIKIIETGLYRLLDVGCCALRLYRYMLYMYMYMLYMYMYMYMLYMYMCSGVVGYTACTLKSQLYGRPSHAPWPLEGMAPRRAIGQGRAEIEQIQTSALVREYSRGLTGLS